MKNFLRSLSLIFSIIILFFILVSGYAILSEGYNVYDPYADTEFAPGYTTEKFKNIKEGMTEKDIVSILGEPISKYSDSTNSKEPTVLFSYTRDGYLRKRADKKFALAGDLAWFGSSVEFNKDRIAIHVFSCWYYD